MVMDFNAESKKPRFIYKHDALVPHTFQICRFAEERDTYEPVGHYILLDHTEDFLLTEKKVINIISLLNGRQKLMDLGNLTKTRVLFSIVPKSSEEDPTKIIFRNHDGDGPSRENAMLVLEKGVVQDDRFTG